MKSVWESHISLTRINRDIFFLFALSFAVFFFFSKQRSLNAINLNESRMHSIYVASKSVMIDLTVCTSFSWWQKHEKKINVWIWLAEKSLKMNGWILSVTKRCFTWKSNGNQNVCNLFEYEFFPFTISFCNGKRCFSGRFFSVEYLNRLYFYDDQFMVNGKLFRFCIN